MQSLKQDTSFPSKHSGPAVYMMSWQSLPAELRLMILEVLLQDGCSLAGFATVSREWQTIIEQHNFSRIKLTPSRLTNFGSMLRRNRRLVSYIWFCLELKEYDCTECNPEDPQWYSLSSADDTLITAAFQDLFSKLSVWEPDGNLLLDISVYSPSDSKHWFKYLTFEPDDAPDMCVLNQHVEQTMLVKDSDQHHKWITFGRISAPPIHAVQKVFGEILRNGLDGDEEEEGQWWQQLPLVPAVTSVLLRQQNRRQWKPDTLAHMFSRLPRLQEIHYEPWREWSRLQQWKNLCLIKLIKSLSSYRLRRFVLFGNFDKIYPDSILHWDYDSMREASSCISPAVAKASLTFEHLSASFMVDASDFFHARKPSWKWSNLTWLALTSKLLVPGESTTELDGMLLGAAAAAPKMPKLETMEIWNAGKGLAMLFRYQANRGRPVVITCRGTWELSVRPPVAQAWSSMALIYHGQELVIVKELIDASASIKFYGDGIHHLKLSRSVIRPISLRQIQMEHMIREGAQS